MGNQHTGGYTWAVGKTMVFFKQQAYERLKFARLELLIKSTTLIQACWRRKVKRQMYRGIRIFTRHLQALLRSKQARVDLQSRRKEAAATKIQSKGRALVERRKYKVILKHL